MDLLNKTVLSLRIRLARNIKDYPFPGKCNDAIAKEICDKVAEALPDLQKTDFTGMPVIEAASYFEKHLVSREFVSNKLPHILLCDKERKTAVMVMEEDHIRAQYITSDETPLEAFNKLEAIDRELNKKLKISFDKNLGYLTECPTNLGIGMRVSAMVFLPGLERTGRIPVLKTELEKTGFTIRGNNGEGSSSHGGLYQISNQTTMGRSEREVLESFDSLLSKICDYEDSALASLSDGEDGLFTDSIMRSYGAAKYARRVSTAELYELYENLRIGAMLGIIDTNVEALDKLLTDAQPNTLQLKAGKADENKRDILRAGMLRSTVE